MLHPNPRMVVKPLPPMARLPVLMADLPASLVAKGVKVANRAAVGKFDFDRIADGASG